MSVGIGADHRLKQRCGDLQRRGDQADLAEVEMVGGFQDRIQSRDHGLHHVIEKMADGDGGQNAERGGLRVVPGMRGEARGKDCAGHFFFSVSGSVGFIGAGIPLLPVCLKSQTD